MSGRSASRRSASLHILLSVLLAGIVLTTGSRALRKVILPGMVLTLATAIGVVFIL